MYAIGTQNIKNMTCILLIVMAGNFLSTTLSWAGQTPSPPPATPDAQTETFSLPEMVMGDPEAPLTIVEFSSLTCGHCAAFHKETVPQLVKEYVETGKVQFKYVHFPLDGYALKAATAIALAQTGHRFTALDNIFANQDKWFTGDTIKQISALAEIPEIKLKKALEDEKIPDTILQTRLKMQKAYNIDATPALLINGKIYTGAATFDELKPIIDKALVHIAAKQAN